MVLLDLIEDLDLCPRNNEISKKDFNISNAVC